MNGKVTWVAVVAIIITLAVTWTNVSRNVGAAEERIKVNTSQIEELRLQTRNIGEIKANVEANSLMLGRLIDKLLEE